MKGNNINATEISTTEDIKSNFHKEAKWIKNLEKNYCKKSVSKLIIGKSPGRDLINRYWYKRLSFYNTY